MKNTIAIVIVGMFLISFASATTISGGECLNVNLSEMESLDNVIYDVAGNSSSIEGMEISLNETIAEVCFPLNFGEDTFTLIFIDNSSRTITKEVHVGGGGSSTRTIYKDRNITKYVDRYINQTDDKEEEQELKEEKNAFLYASLVVLITFCIILTYKLIKNRRNKVEEEGISDED